MIDIRGDDWGVGRQSETFEADGLIGGHDDGLVDIFGECTAGEIVDGSGQTLKHRTNSLYAAKTLHELVGDIAHFERGNTSTLARPERAELGALLGPHRAQERRRPEARRRG